MRAEIREQPAVLLTVLETMGAALAARSPLPFSLRRLGRVVVFGSGSSYHAALLTRDYLEALAGIPARAAPASEAFRWDEPEPDRVLALAISHSGSSADVRSAVVRARAQGIATAAISNVPRSPLEAEVEAALVTGAGRERAVPSTKGFTAAVLAGYLLASHAAAARGRRAAESEAQRVRRAAAVLEGWLSAEETFVAIRALAARLAPCRAIAVLGGGVLYPVACDGALKLIEITYAPALAFAPEEFRHGPIAMTEPGVAVLALVGRGGKPSLARLLRQARETGAEALAVGSGSDAAIAVPRVDAWLAPLVYAPALQILALEIGGRLGRSVDRPRHLQKVVGY